MRVGAVLAAVGAVGALLSVAVGGVGGHDGSPAAGTVREGSPAEGTVREGSRPVGTARESAAPAPARPVGRKVTYRPPVSAPITNGYRPPATPFGPGNRGIDYGTKQGQVVKAAGDGVVTFAGQVGGTLHVTIGHADGVRTSYSFLGRVKVRRGQQVRLGQPIGMAGARPLHLGARRGTAYIDPRTLFGREGFTVRLVPARRGR